MKKLFAKFSWYEPLQQLANFLEFTVTHAIQIRYDNEYSYHNSCPQSRLIFVESVVGDSGGCIEVLSGGKVSEVFPLHANTLLFLPPNLDLVFRYKQGLSCTGIHFNLNLIPGVDIFETQTAVQVIPFNDTDALARLNFAIWSKDRIPDLLWTKGFLLSVASQFVENEKIESHLGAMRFAQKYSSIIKYIDSNIRINVEPRQIAGQYNLTYESFKRNFKRDAGITLHAWIARRVARVASRALAETDEPLKSIAARLGFSSPIYFNRFIKKQLKLSPKQYRERQVALKALSLSASNSANSPSKSRTTSRR